jgi:flagellar basal-body rod modification protein FlgD
LADGEATFAYALSENAARTAVIILDAAGKPVRSEIGESKAGKHTFAWDGEDNDGSALPDGLYSVEVAAFDKDGKAIDVATGASGRVTGVQIVDGEIVLSLGELQVPFSDVYAVRATEENDRGLI